MTKRLPRCTQIGTRDQREAKRLELRDRRHAHEIAVENRSRAQLIRRQGVVVNLRLDGPQYVAAQAVHAGKPGAHISVSIGTVVVTFTDPATVVLYHETWRSVSMKALTMARWEPFEPTHSYREPGVVVHADLKDAAKSFITGTTVTVRLGQLIWEIADRDAYRTVMDMWQAVRDALRRVWQPA